MKLHILVPTLIASFGLASAALAASLPEMNVKVTSKAGKVVYKGSTDASGTFTTSTLAPGNYIVLFNAKDTPKGGPFSLSVSAGKAESYANSVSGSKFSAGGVAMKVEVTAAAPLNGQILHAGETSKASTASSKAAASTPVPADGIRMEGGVKVRYEHGKKYVWYQNSLSTQGGHWVDADSREGKQALGGDH